MSLPYPTDPSLPSNPAPLFGDTTAARADHLRANNAEIWANFTEIVGTMLGNASISTDGTFASVVDTLFPSVKAAKTYIDYAMRYDYVIDSQAKFDALVVDSTWVGAKNVLFTTDVSAAAQITIPATVEKIHAINGATLTVTGLTTGQYGFGYAIAPTASKFEIKGLSVSATGTGIINGFYKIINADKCNSNVTTSGTTNCGYGFYECARLIDCTATVNGNASPRSFYNCNQLTNCTGTVTTTATGTGTAFYNCNQLTNCTGNAIGSVGQASTAFYNCNQLTNCTGDASASVICTAFHNCNQLTNCTGSASASNGAGIAFHNCNQLTNCTGFGNSTNSTGHGFYNCTYAGFCKKTAACTTATWGGTNTKIRGCEDVSDDA